MRYIYIYNGEVGAMIIRITTQSSTIMPHISSSASNKLFWIPYTTVAPQCRPFVQCSPSPPSTAAHFQVPNRVFHGYI